MDEGALSLVRDAASELRSYRSLAERAIAQVSEEQLHAVGEPEGNSIAVLMQHVAGNLRSRWTDFLTTDGEKPWRDRDGEFVDQGLARDELMARWTAGWDRLLETLDSLMAEDLDRTVTIRNKPLTVTQAMLRALAHCAYHVGQIVQLARTFAGPDWQSLSIPKRRPS